MTGSDAYAGIAAAYAARNAGADLTATYDRLAAVLPPPARLLDVGCGTGRDAAALRARGYTVCGIDRSSAMLRQAPGSLRGALAVADARALPAAAGSCDGALAVASLLHLPKAALPAALGELRRSVRPRGMVLVSLKRGTGEETETAAYGVPRFYAYYGETELRACLAAAALTVIDLGADAQWLTAIAERRAE